MAFDPNIADEVAKDCHPIGVSWKIFYLRQTEQVFSTDCKGSWSIVAAIAFPQRQKTNVNKVCFRTFLLKT